MSGPSGKKVQAFNNEVGISRADLWMFPTWKPGKVVSGIKALNDGEKSKLGGLIIIGHDTDHTNGSHRLWRNDVTNPAKPYLVDSIRKHGIITPIRARKLSKENDREAEVVVGRDRVKASRVVADERLLQGILFKIPVMVYPIEATDEEIIGAANAENMSRKQETLLDTIEHLYMHALAAGYPANERAINEVSTSTGIDTHRIRAMFELRSDTALMGAVSAGLVKGEAALALTRLPTERRAQELQAILDNPNMDRTTAGVRERVTFIMNALREDGEAAADDADDADDDADDAYDALADAATVETAHYAGEPVQQTLTDAGTLADDPAPAAPKKAKKKKTTAAKPSTAADKFPGISPRLAKRLYEDQIVKENRTIPEDDLEVLALVAGLLKPKDREGYKAALKRIGFA